MPKVLVTVYMTMLDFFEKNAGAKVFFQGSTLSRNRLYRVAIAKTHRDLAPNLRIFGFIDGEIEAFEPNREYDSFMFQLKNLQIS